MVQSHFLRRSGLKQTVRMCGLLLVIATMPHASCLAQGAKQEGASALRQRFDEYDRDRNGIIIYPELTRARKQAFKKIDGDDNGMLREGEFMAYQAKLRGKRQSRRQFSQIQRGFYRLDRDHDKSLTLDEYLGAADRQLDVLDANRDGKITWQEFSRSTSSNRRSRSRR